MSEEAKKNLDRIGDNAMSEEAKKNLDWIGDKLSSLPDSVAADALMRYAERMEGFVEGFQAGKASTAQPN